MSSLLKIAGQAPEFKATAVDGNAIRLSSLLKNGPVVLVFLRGFS
jgi:peroxiredoxin